MNQIRQIQELNKRELEAGISPEASWHTDYRDTAYVYIGGLPFNLSEGDIITIFSQYGEPTYINLIREKETGKSRGFAFLKYEDQRSTDLAVDNLTGAVIMGRTLRVDHTRYKKKDDAPDEGMDLTAQTTIEATSENETEEEKEKERPTLKEERELADLIRDHDDDDPMKAFLIEEKKEEIQRALSLFTSVKSSEHHHKSKHRHRRSHRSREDTMSRDRSHRSRRHHHERDYRASRSPPHHSDRRRTGDEDKPEQRRHHSGGT